VLRFGLPNLGGLIAVLRCPDRSLNLPAVHVLSFGASVEIEPERDGPILAPVPTPALWNLLWLLPQRQRPAHASAMKTPAPG
jgi:hypothetical protein